MQVTVCPCAKYAVTLRSIAQQAHGGADAQPIPGPHAGSALLSLKVLRCLGTIDL